MDVGGAVGVAAHYSKQLSRGAGGVNGVLGRFKAVEPEFAVLVGAELASEVVAGLVLGVEDVVLAVGAGLPHIEDCTRDALAGVDVLHDTVEKRELPVFWHILDYAGAKVPEWCFWGPERSENSGGCGSATVVSNDPVVDLVDETRQTLLAIDGRVHDVRGTSTHDSIPKISHTRHVSFRFFW